MKWIVLLFLILFLLAIIATRFRSQIKTGIQIWHTLKRKNAENQTKQVGSNFEAGDVPLIKCAKCGNWVAQTEALKLQSGITYCSSDCLEKSTVSNKGGF